MFDLNKILPCEELNCKIIVVTGPTRCGKSSYVSARVKRDYVKNAKRRFQESLIIVNQLRDNGYPNARLDHNLYFANEWLLLDAKENITAWDCDFVKLGMPNEKYKVQNLPYGSVVALFECDQTANARDNTSGLNEYVRALLKYHGHNNLTIILDMQDFSRLAKEFRLFVHQVIFIEGKKSYRFFKWTYKTKWWCRVVDLAYLNFIKSLENLNIKVEEDSYMKETTFTFYGDIHKYYDHQSGFAYFYNGVDHFDYKKVERTELNRESIEDFCKRHPLVPPKDFKKGSSKDIKEFVNSCPAEIKKSVDNLTKQFKDYLYDKFRKGEFNDYES